VVTMLDAMVTQTTIAQKRISKGPHYILAVKKSLSEEIIDEFRFGKKVDFFEHIDIGHGRIETRKRSVISNYQFIHNEDENRNEKWKNLKSIIKLERIREFKNSSKQVEIATKHCIPNHPESPKILISNIKAHWEVKINYIGYWEYNSRKINQEKEMEMLLNIIRKS